MSTVTIEVDAELHASIAVCIAERDEGMRQAEEADRTGWNKSLIDKAIDVFAASGQIFSSNDVRVVLPDDLPGSLFGSRFSYALHNRGVIKFVGMTKSTKPNTHGKAVNLYVGRPVDA